MRLFNINTNVYPRSYRDFYLPKWVYEKSTMVAFLVLAVVWAYFSSRHMDVYIYVLYILEILGFFYGANALSRKWSKSSSRQFAKNVVKWGILIRVVFCIFQYYMSVQRGGGSFLIESDEAWYVPSGKEIAEGFMNLDFSFFGEWLSWGVEIGDLGYPIWLGLVYLLTGFISDAFIPLMVKAIVGGLTCYSIYRLAGRHFGESVARMTAIFCMLNPNMIWWCGSLMKETEMVFLTVLFADLMDQVIRGRKFTFKTLWPAVTVGLYLILFRAALALVCFMAFFAAVVLASNRIVSTGKKVIAGAIVGLVLLVGFGNQLAEQTQQMYENVVSGGQQTNMEWRSRRTHGNEFAKYAGAAVFAPLIFTIPFPTLAFSHEGQIPLMEVAGGNVVKNLMSYFVILSMFVLLLTGEWREHIFPIALLCGYLAVLVVSAYAQSGRFHMPAIPFEMLFAAYGIHLAKNTAKFRRWWTYAVAFEFVACIGWQWFKLRGQGLI